MSAVIRFDDDETPPAIAAAKLIHAAGILFVTKDKRALFIKRGNGGDHPNEWAFPGGQLEDGETALEAAERECLEEIGVCPNGARELWARRIAADPAIIGEAVGDRLEDQVAPPLPEVDFSTFVQVVDKEFPVEALGDESTGWAWASLSEPPAPLHPGCAVALAKFDMDELGIARSMAAGDLTSPQHYYNVWLFDIRITGTGTSYRKKLDEVVYRHPDNYLSDDFLARCNGLPVIWYHPEKSSTLNSEEFAKRIVGTIFLPYIRNDEVWGIAKVYDDDAARAMQEQQLSTSPAVVFRDKSVNTTLAREDGGTLLIEGNPSLLDHIAICGLGVWDKGGSPVGVARGDSAMADKDEDEKKAREEKERSDATTRRDARMKKFARKDDESDDDYDARYSEAENRGEIEGKDIGSDDGAKLNKVLEVLGDLGERLDSVRTRMDAYDKERADSEKARADAEAAETERKAKEGDPAAIAADKARKDAEDEEKRKKEEEEEARKDAQEAEWRKNVEARLPRELSDEDRAAFAIAQARADSAAQAWGQHAPRNMNGESLLDYRLRLIAPFQKHSTPWGKTNLRAISADPSTLDMAEGAIYADAVMAARAGSDLAPGVLREIVTETRGGHKVSTFHGDWATAFGPFMAPARAVVRIGVPRVGE